MHMITRAVHILRCTTCRHHLAAFRPRYRRTHA